LGLGAQGVEIDGLGLLLRLRGPDSCEPANRQTPAIARVSATRRTRIGKPPGLPLPRTQPYLEFYLNHAKINDESPRAAFSID
jgi:hypothetical protein